MFQQAREYLAKVVHWPEPGGGYVNLHWTVPNPQWIPTSPKHIKTTTFKGRPFTSVEQAAKHLEYLSKRDDTRDVYLCLSSQKDCNTYQGNNGRPYTTAIRGAHNAVALKSLFIDLDAKGEDKNSYATPGDALKALTKFVSETGLPRPSVVVFSGGGLHVYWTLVRALTPAEWVPLAYALAEATKRHGLKCDTQCTVDCARVLRVPETKNFKTSVPGSVRLVGKIRDYDYNNERIEKALEPYKVASPKVVTATQDIDTSLFPRKKPLETSELSMGVDTSKYAPIVLDDVLPECGFLNEAVTTGGKDFGNPLWSLTTLIATFCDNGRAQAHRMGDKHPGYEPAATDELFDRKIEDKERKNLGWPSCSTISSHGSKHCTLCKHLAKGKSPLNFGMATTVATPTTSQLALLPTGCQTPQQTTSGHPSDLPSGYTRRIDGVVCEIVRAENDTDKLVPVSDYVMLEPWLQKDPCILHFTTVTDRGTVKAISLPFEEVGTQSMRGTLQFQGMMLGTGKGPENTARFFVSWIKKLQETRDSVKSSPFGWTVRGGTVEGFVYGGSIWTPTGERPSANPDPVLQRQYQPSGDITPWLGAAKMVTGQNRHDIAAIVASAFAAPLIRFTGQPGVLMSAYSSESGIGKTTALKVAQAVWGDPTQAIQSLSDTQNSVMNKLGELRSLPLYWDELKTDDDTRKFVNITFQTTVGKEKSRMRANITQREPGTWQTLLVSASNDSLLDFVVKQTNTTTAGIYRIFEYVVSPPLAGALGQIDTADAALITSKLNDNYGLVGLEYAKFLGANHEAVAKDVKDYLNKLGAEVSTKPDERFWLALIACICLGAKYANQLGFTTFNMEGLKAFMLKVLKKMRGEIDSQPVDMGKAMNVSAMLVQFLSAMQAKHTLWTNKVHVSKGPAARGSIKILRDATRLESMAVQIGMEDKVLRISSVRLGEWLDDKKYSRHLFVSALEKEFGFRKITGRLGSGTELSSISQEYLMQLDMIGVPMFGDFIKEM